MIPVRSRVIIKPDSKEERTEGGIILPEGQKELPGSGVIIAVGCDEEGKPLPIDVGDRVIFNKYAGDNFRHKGSEYKVVEFDHVWMNDSIEANEWCVDTT